MTFIPESTKPETSEEVELLPCPFCGGRADYAPIGNGIWCDGCEVEMHNGPDGIPSHAEQWNTRVSAPPAGQNVERMPAGMKAWHGDDRAPADWDGGPVWTRNCAILPAFGVTDWLHCGNDADIIAYTPFAAAPSVAIGAGEAAAFGASDAACYLYPGEDQQPQRAAFCAGAAHVAPLSASIPARYTDQQRTAMTAELIGFGAVINTTGERPWWLLDSDIVARHLPMGLSERKAAYVTTWDHPFRVRADHPFYQGFGQWALGSTSIPADVEREAQEAAIAAMGFKDPRMIRDGQRCLAGHQFTTFGFGGECFLTSAQVVALRRCYDGARAALAARPSTPQANDGTSIPDGMKPWGPDSPGYPKAPDDSDRGPVLFASGNVFGAPAGSVWKLGWDHSYGEGNVVAYTPKVLPLSGGGE